MPIRVLLAEDNEPLVHLLTKFLTAKGLEVIAAPTGLAALRHLATTPIDLVLLDLRLPERSGLEVLQRLRRSPRGANLPVIIMTGVYKGDTYVEATQRLGVRHYLEKPFTKEAFTTALDDVLTEIKTKTSQSFLEILLNIYGKRRSGVLTIQGSFPITFIKGEPVSFQTRGHADFFQYLVERSILTAEEQQKLVALRVERLYLTQAGHLTYDDLVEESAHYLALRLSGALSKNPPVVFQEELGEEEHPFVPQSVPRLLYEMTQEAAPRFNSAAFNERYGTRFVSRSTLFYRRINFLELREDDITILELIDGHKTVGTLLKAVNHANQAAAFLHYLLICGMINLFEGPATEPAADFPLKTLFNRPLEQERAPLKESSVGFDDLVEEVANTVNLDVDGAMDAPLTTGEIDFEQTVQREYGQLKDKNYYEIFGLDRRSFQFSALKDAYFARTRQYPPEKFMELSGATQELAEEILSIYANAYNTLSNVVAKERYDELLNENKVVGLDGRQDDKLQAKIQFQSGSVFLDMGEYENAERAFQEAYTLEPENPLHCAYLAWAIYKNPASRQSKSGQDRAISLLTKSLGLEKTAKAYTFRGLMLLDEGRDGLAEGEFLKALKHNSAEVEARKGLRLIAEKREAEKKGIFRRIFG
jgi:DNA-binding response OmpR family regulator